MNDPERIARRPKPRHEYPLRGRIKCRLCGCGDGRPDDDRQGQAVPLLRLPPRLRPPHRPNLHGRNVRADRLEPAIWREIRAKLTSPEVILQELRARPARADRDEIRRTEQRLAEIAEQERRLVKALASGRSTSAW